MSYLGTGGPYAGFATLRRYPKTPGANVAETFILGALTICTNQKSGHSLYINNELAFEAI